jgi:hypothetical protein
LGLGEEEAALMRAVGHALGATTRDAAQSSGALFVDMAPTSAAHAVGSAQPWVSGAGGQGVVPFHPTLEGTLAMAKQAALALGFPIPADGVRR